MIAKACQQQLGPWTGDAYHRAGASNQAVTCQILFARGSTIGPEDRGAGTSYPYPRRIGVAQELNDTESGPHVGKLWEGREIASRIAGLRTEGEQVLAVQREK
jgi:hypothetical protein